MSRLSFDTAEVLVYDPVSANRNATRAALYAIGFRRIETVAAMPAHRGRYAVATARALTSMSAFLELAGPFLAPGGRALGMRSTEEPLSSSPSAEEILYQLPDGTPRRLLVVRT